MRAASAVLFPDLEGHWFSVSDADPRAAAILRRHYSARRNGAKGKSDNFVGPGEKIVLLTARCDALWVWRAERFRMDAQTGISCSVFRNESPILSSELIREADEIAWKRWPGLRHFTYVWPSKIRSSNPGFCFLRAGWSKCGTNADGRLTILEIYPPDERAEGRTG
jgi:hypothetical protein